MFFDLPQEILLKIYDFDNTYKEIFNIHVLPNILIASWKIFHQKLLKMNCPERFAMEYMLSRMGDNSYDDKVINTSIKDMITEYYHYEWIFGMDLIIIRKFNGYGFRSEDFGFDEVDDQYSFDEYREFVFDVFADNRIITYEFNGGIVMTDQKYILQKYETKVYDDKVNGIFVIETNWPSGIISLSADDRNDLE